jgi:ring-1,2-phenylacetyl-CoA epoxidase subunit PaaC
MNNALGKLWMYTAELSIPASYELIDVSKLKEAWQEKINKVFEEATLTSPLSPALGGRERPGVRTGKEGSHTEYFGYLLTEMQYLQRTYPNSQW